MNLIKSKEMCNIVFEPTHDPFVELLISQDDTLELSDDEIAAAPSPVIIENMNFSFLQPPYMLFEDQAQTKRKLLEAYTQREFLLLYGYSGCGKTTVLKQFSEKYPYYVQYFSDFSSMSTVGLISHIGSRINLPLKLRMSEIISLEESLKHTPNIILMFDEVDASNKKSTHQKLELLRKIHAHTGIPMVLCGTQKLYIDLHDERRFDDYCSILSRLDEHEMRGMRQKDAIDYLQMLEKAENVRFTWQAQQALIPVALNKKLGGISSFTKIIGRSITHARANYYTSNGRSIPENAKCIRSDIRIDVPYPGTEVSFTLPVTPDQLVIDEYLISSLLADFKSQCKMSKKIKPNK